MGYDDHHDNLNLGLGISAVKKQPPSSNASTITAEPSLTLALSTGSTGTDHHYSGANNKSGPVSSTVIDINKGAFVADANANNNGSYGRQASPASAVSSFSGGGAVAIKREREVMSSEEAEVDHDEKVSNSRDQSVDEDEDGSNARKKLRLTKDQSALLEESFKQHSTLNPKQKQALARQLNLRARQVEVWFQNRRARTKLKQTEVDCEFLKKCCETLTDENRRLQKELQELKALKLAQPLYMHMPAATLTMCPSCERIGAPASATSAGDLIPGGGGGAGGGGVGIGLGVGVSKSPFSSMAHHPKPHFYNPFTNPSAAC